jgi:hypothetical protein
MLASATGLSTFFTLLLSFPGLQDWLKIFVLGSVLETLRRTELSILGCALSSFFVTIHLDVRHTSLLAMAAYSDIHLRT